jgi:Type I phosphodiesterase / nucleotide pyrophosphatase
MSRKLAILHIDGLSADALEKALAAGHMKRLRQLIRDRDYEIHRYRCGLPSTTPFAQAGILYGDNSEIPSFRWWDRERRVVVQFGAGSTFKKVADKYFAGCTPLTKDGACIAACYPAGAADDFGISYHDRTYGQDEGSRSAATVLVPYLANPLHLGDWVWQTAAVAVRTTRDYFTSRSEGRHPARQYVTTDVVEEIFVHHLTRYAVQKAMREGYSPIYAGFYAYDETAHAFGPNDPSAVRVLSHVDHTIAKIASTGERLGYELVVLSDHGQVDTVPFDLGAEVARLAPGVQVETVKGTTHGAPDDEATARIRITGSGGLAHLYLLERARRADFSEVEQLACRVSQLREVGLVMARAGDSDVFLHGGSVVEGSRLRDVLAGYDDAEILHAQLARLNSFANCGDIVVFGAFIDGKQVNFERQAGGHGSIGGDQLHPFVLARKELGLDLSGVTGAHRLHPVLSDLRERLA